MKTNEITLYDNITGYDITTIEGDFYLVIDGKVVKLADNEIALNKHINKREEN